MTFTPQPAKFSQIRGDVVLLKCSGLTKKWLVPGWRVGWLTVFGGEETKLIREGIRNLLDVILMPHSIIQGQLPKILQDETHDSYLSEKMKLLQKNQEYLFNQLSTEDYCEVTDSQGALYSTINIDNKRFPHFKNTEDFSLEFFKQEVTILASSERSQLSRRVFLQSRLPSTGHVLRLRGYCWVRCSIQAFLFEIPRQGVILIGLMVYT